MRLIDINNPILRSKSIPDLRSMADQGDINALAFLAWMYSTGNHRIGGREDMNEAILLARKLVEICRLPAQEDNPYALFNLTDYENDPDVKHGMLLVAHQHFIEEAKAGNAEAQFVMALYHLNGLAGYIQDSQEADQWFQKAAQGGHITALYHVWSQEQNANTKLRWLFKGYELNYAWAITELAAHYQKGVLLDRDCAKAAELMNRAAEMGDFGAKYLLAVWHEHGICVDVNIPRSIYLLREVSDWMDDDGRRYLANLERNHHGQLSATLTKSDDKKQWWKIW